jgi:acetylornithine deacetylase/succinyl-diaminopimelate desuccinylase-like protein
MNRYILKVRSQFEEQLRSLIEIPTVSLDPRQKGAIDRGAQCAARYLEAIGFRVEIVPTRGNPVVFGSFIRNPRHPTVTLYNHLDVQPADGSEWRRAQHTDPATWDQIPFTFYQEGDRYEGRGATDDKGPALTALFAIQFCIENNLPLNFKVIWELEEEIGSPHFADFMREKQKALECDSVVVSDTIWIARNRPAIPYGLRGLQTFLFRLKTQAKDLHSGLTGGGVRNPIGELCQLITDCYDAQTGRVKIKGFYDAVRPLTQKEKKDFRQSGFQISRFKKAHELSSIRPHIKSDLDLLRALTALPTFELHGLVGGYTGPGVKTIVPHQAEMKISTRLVPDQNPKQIVRLVRDFVKARNPQVQVLATQCLEPYLGACEGPFAEAARAAMRDGFGAEPVFIREGGSIGAVVTMQKRLHVPITFLGLSLPEHGYHAKNECYDWGQASGGMRMFIRYFETLSKIPPRKSRR